MKKTIIALSLIFAASAWAKKPSVEIGLLLDSSGSMGGLIDKTRNKIWLLVNDLENVQKDGVPAEVKLALYSYGNGNNPDAINEIVKISGLTTDLDVLSEDFFKLQASGSSELAGTVVSKAVSELQWSSDQSDFKALFLAGNETLKQGEIEIGDAAAEAVEQDVLLNTIYADDSSGHTTIRIPTCTTRHCRNPHPPSQPSPPSEDHQISAIEAEWMAAAKAGQGSYAYINHNAEDIQIETPYDDQILALDKELNKTFIPFGPNGQAAYDRMINVDGSIGGTTTGSAVSRGRYKVGHNYDTSSWDLVEAYEKGKVDLSTLKDEDLPDSLKGKTVEEIIAVIEETSELREEIKAETKALYAKRADYIVQKKKELAEQGEGDPLDVLMINALREQLKAKGFTFSDSE